MIVASARDTARRRIGRAGVSGALLALALMAGCAHAPHPPAAVGRPTGEEGLASFYSSPRGRLTASGARFDRRALTAAHRTLPFGTRVRVTNLANGRSLVVTITDRGPHRAHRIIDLSKAAARVLDFLDSGTARVRLDVLAE